MHRVMASNSTQPHLTSPEIQSFVSEIGNRFAIGGTFVEGEEIYSGHINSTFRATYELPDGSRHRYILQQINSSVFKDPMP
jgi:hypothetical protein